MLFCRNILFTEMGKEPTLSAQQQRTGSLREIQKLSHNLRLFLISLIFILLQLQVQVVIL